MTLLVYDSASWAEHFLDKTFERSFAVSEMLYWYDIQSKTVHR